MNFFQLENDAIGITQYQDNITDILREKIISFNIDDRKLYGVGGVLRKNSDLAKNDLIKHEISHIKNNIKNYAQRYLLKTNDISVDTNKMVFSASWMHIDWYDNEMTLHRVYHDHYNDLQYKENFLIAIFYLNTSGEPDKKARLKILPESQKVKQNESHSISKEISPNLIGKIKDNFEQHVKVFEFEQNTLLIAPGHLTHQASAVSSVYENPRLTFATNLFYYTGDNFENWQASITENIKNFR